MSQSAPHNLKYKRPYSLLLLFSILHSLFLSEFFIIPSFPSNSLAILSLHETSSTMSARFEKVGQMRVYQIFAVLGIDVDLKSDSLRKMFLEPLLEVLPN